MCRSSTRNLPWKDGEKISLGIAFPGSKPPFYTSDIHAYTYTYMLSSDAASWSRAVRLLLGDDSVANAASTTMSGAAAADDEAKRRGLSVTASSAASLPSSSTAFLRQVAIEQACDILRLETRCLALKRELHTVGRSNREVAAAQTSSVTPATMDAPLAEARQEAAMLRATEQAMSEALAMKTSILRHTERQLHDTAAALEEATRDAAAQQLEIDELLRRVALHEKDAREHHLAQSNLEQAVDDLRAQVGERDRIVADLQQQVEDLEFQVRLPHHPPIVSTATPSLPTGATAAARDDPIAAPVRGARQPPHGAGRPAGPGSAAAKPQPAPARGTVPHAPRLLTGTPPPAARLAGTAAPNASGAHHHPARDTLHPPPRERSAADGSGGETSPPADVVSPLAPAAASPATAVSPPSRRPGGAIIGYGIDPILSNHRVYLQNLAAFRPRNVQVTLQRHNSLLPPSMQQASAAAASPPGKRLPHHHDPAAAAEPAVVQVLRRLPSAALGSRESLTRRLYSFELEHQRQQQVPPPPSYAPPLTFAALMAQQHAVATTTTAAQPFGGSN